MADTAKAILAVIDGVVQGVGFRWYVEALAKRVALTGYVKNRFDGTVET